jgi:transposase
VIVSTVAAKRTRGPNRAPAWSRKPEDGLSVLRLGLDVADPVMRDRVAGVFDAGFSIYRAVQRDARNRCEAYRAASHERDRDPAATRTRLGLTRKGLEHAAYRHVDGAPHLRRSLTKALAMHLADSVWNAIARHLFRDASGKTHGLLHVGRWHEFTRLPGRARLHKTPRKWETFRLHGSLAGHRAAYTGNDGRFFQPRRLHAVTRPADGWWSHAGPLTVVFTGLPDGDLVMPVRLPAAPANQPTLDHHLADPDRWHRIDLVRHQDPNVVGGWRYEAHLSVLVEPYVAPAVAARRAGAATDTAGRAAGIDVNVSNLTVASHDGAGGDLQITRIARDADERDRQRWRARRDRRRARRLDRSRRAANPEQYALSERQVARADRRVKAGQHAPQVIPQGPRVARADGKPVRAYRHDRLSKRYRRERAAQVADARAATQARRGHARQVAGVLVRDHGFRFTVEDCDLRTWALRWGRSLAAFSPGTLLSAVEHEANAVAAIAGLRGGLRRAGTRTTALSQHCLCGERVDKSLGDRVHVCTSCGLRGDRDAVAATLAAFVVLARRGEPASAVVDYDTAAAALRLARTRATLDRTITSPFRGRQDARSESTASSARDGSSIVWAGRTPDIVVVARRIVGTAPPPTPDETGPRGQTTSDRRWMRTNLSSRGGACAPPLRDSS